MYQTRVACLCTITTKLAEVRIADAAQPAPAPRPSTMPALADLRTTLPMRFGPLWRFLQRVGPLERAVNRALINQAINVLPPRPYRLSTKRDFTTQDTLVDKAYNCRQLEPAESTEPRIDPDPARRLLAGDELPEIVHRNVAPGARMPLVRLTREDWKRA